MGNTKIIWYIIKFMKVLAISFTIIIGLIEGSWKGLHLF